MTETETEYEPTAEDAQHIQRLQELRSLGTHNMFTELNAGLTELFGSEGRETYEWTIDHFEYFKSSEWVDIDPTELADDE